MPSPVDVNVTCLSDTMTSVLCLGIHCGVPVTVVKDDRVSTCQVDTDASRASRQDEAEDSPVHVEAFHENLGGRRNNHEST